MKIHIKKNVYNQPIPQQYYITISVSFFEIEPESYIQT